MPFPLHITWFQADQGAVSFDLHFSTSRPLSIPLVDCHQEILNRPGPSPAEISFGMSPANYLLKRSTWIQERLLSHYVTGVREGISNEGYFYGVFQQYGFSHEFDGVRLDGEVVFLNEGPTHLLYRIGLLYLPASHSTYIANTPVSDAEVERRNLPTQMLPTHAKRDIYDSEGAPEAIPDPPRRSRYERNPII